MESSKGQVLAGAKDMTLYTFDKDSKGESSCYDTCAKNWPPFKAMKGAKASGAYTLVKRKDGSEQWAKGWNAALLLGEGQEARRCDRRRR